MEDKGGLSGVGMFVSITRRCQQGDRLEKYFLACQRRDPLTGLRHRKSCDSFHGLLSVFPFVTSLQSTFQQQCETDWSHYFILFNRLLPAPEGRSCIKPQVCNICCMGFWTTVFKRELYCKIHPLGLFHTLPLVYLQYIITYVSVYYHQTVQLWSSTFLRRLQGRTNELPIWRWSRLHVSTGCESAPNPLGNMRLCATPTGWDGSEWLHLSNLHVHARSPHVHSAAKEKYPHGHIYAHIWWKQLM